VTETTERTALGEAILKHWRENCPQMVRDLERQNRLDQAVLEAQETTGDLLYELVSVKKMNYPQAWELAAQEWALPQSGSEDETTSGDLPPPPNPSGISTPENSTSATSHQRRPPLRRATSG
jgi:hypothetical protein